MSVKALIDAFAQELGQDIPVDQHFGHPTAGACDSAQGVQWNTWISARDNAAYFGVNLEGMKYDGWPVARFIEREFRHAGLFEVRTRCSHPEQVQVIWRRIAWQGASSPAIQERDIGISRQMLSDVTREAWRDTLLEAYQCLDASKGHRGRGTQIVTVKRGRVECGQSSVAVPTAHRGYAGE